MSYIINKTDGSILTEVVDGTIDQIATDLTLIGKNSSSYGEFLNENLVHILENFANTSAPTHPIQGQLWFDTSENRLKVYDGNGFKVSGGTVVSTVVPTLVQGDIWIDSFRQQLYFNDGVSTLLAGPGYTAQQGVTGFNIGDIVDTNSINHTVIYLYVAQVLLGIFSKSAFTPALPVAGYTGSIEVGFNVSNYSGVKIHAPVTQADSLLAADSTLKTAESFLSTTDNSTTQGTISIQNTTPLVLGPGGSNGSSEIKVTGNTFQINSNSIDQSFEINSLSSAGLLPSIHIDSATQQVGIYTDVPTATLDVAGDAVIRGSLTVNGNLTTINTTNLVIEDKLIELGVTADPSNDTADGGGITIVAGADIDKQFTYSKDSESWLSTENINIASGKSYQINGFQVLSSSGLGTTVTSSYLTSVGTLTSLQVSKLSIAAGSSTISFVSPVISDGDIGLAPKGAGSVDVNSTKIINLANPVDPTDGVNLITLNNKVKTAPLALSDLDISYPNIDGYLSDTQIADLVTILYPVSEHNNDTVCRVMCVIPQAFGQQPTRIPKRFRILAGVWTFEANL